MAYIDRDKLLKELSTMYKPLTTSMTVGYDHAIADVVVVVHEQPTADMVEVVRCKECKHNPSEDEWIHCNRVAWWNSPDDYCSRGERKEVGDE